MVNEICSKRILLTGGSGFLGSCVVDELISRGVKRENIVIPRSRDLDLRKWENCQSAVKDSDVVYTSCRKGRRYRL